MLDQARRQGALTFPGPLQPLRANPAWKALLAQACRTEWDLYCKPPLAGPKRVLKYLARYTYRGAISNRRPL